MVEYPAAFNDLLNAPGIVVLTTNGPTGWPQTTAVCFLLDDDGVLKISLNVTRQKTKNLQRDARCTLLFLDPANPYRTLEVRGVAHLTPDVDKVFAVKAGNKYHADFRTNDRPGEERVVVAIEPVKINTFGV